MARGVWVDRCGDRGSTASCESEWESILVGTNKVAFSGYKMQDRNGLCPRCINPIAVKLLIIQPLGLLG